MVRPALVTRDQVFLAAKTAIAAGLAWVAALAADPHSRPYFAARLGPQGVVQVPASALLVFLVGQTTPGYAGERIVDTLIGAGVAVIAVLLTPSAPAPPPSCRKRWRHCIAVRRS
jgi:uncharacterized membrane protein YgaE (UPF0421/DUF939 family)